MGVSTGISTGKSVAIAAFVIAASYLAVSYHIPTRAAEDPVGPRMYPLLIGLGMLIISIMLWLEARKEEPAIRAQVDPALRRRQLIGVLSVSAGTVLYAVTMESIGYLIGTFLLMMGVTSAFHRGKPMTNFLVSLGTTIVLYYGLKRFLGVPLPAGLLPFLG